jgi:hypothetical protein
VLVLGWVAAVGKGFLEKGISGGMGEILRLLAIKWLLAKKLAWVLSEIAPTAL